MKSLRSAGRAVAARAAVEEFRLALERRRVGQHREAGGAARLVGARERRRIEIGADQALRRARLLDLGDQRVVAGARACVRSRRGSRAARARPWRRLRPRRAGARAWPPRSPRACRLRSWRGCRSSGVRHLRSAGRAGSSASPESIDLVASATPSFRSLALPATTSAAAALSSATSRNGPFLPLSTSMQRRRVVSASPPRSSSGFDARQADILRLDLERASPCRSRAPPRRSGPSW